MTGPSPSVPAIVDGTEDPQSTPGCVPISLGERLHRLWL